MRKTLIALAFVACATPAFASRYAIVENGTVTNVIEGDGSSDFMASFPNAVALKSPGGIGSTYSGGNFSVPPTPAASAHNWISATKFLLRFTTQERIAIRTSTDPIVQDFIGLINTAVDVDLTDPATTQGVQYLESSGLIGSGRAAQILK